MRARYSLLLLILLGCSYAALSQEVIAEIPVGTQPVAMAVNSTTNMIYVASQVSNTVSVIDGATNSVVATCNAPS